MTERHAPSPDQVLDGVAPLVRRLHQLHTRLWHENVGPELTAPQYTVLAALVEHGELDHTALCAASHLDKATLTSLLNRLRTRGLVEERHGDTDRRRRLITVSDAGRDTVRRVTPAAAATSDELLAGLADDDGRRLAELLRQALD